MDENEYLGGVDPAIVAAALCLRRRRRRQITKEANSRGTRRYWVCPTNSRRPWQGAWENFVQELMIDEPEKFANYHRLTVPQFEFLLKEVAPIIQKAHKVRKPIPAGLKLSLTLRFLASGESMVSLAYSYRIGKSTTSSIIKETCKAIWMVLEPKHLKAPDKNEWDQIARDFNNIWNFPNCCGAVDGKHIVVQCFKKTGSHFYNYKGTFSTSLVAVVDAHYRFRVVSIGSKGRESDGGIFQRWSFGIDLAKGRLPLPAAAYFNGCPIRLPPVFVGDQAFPLLENLMRPYPSSSNLPPEQIVFNYRLSRARRVVENAFGILANRFRVFRRPIIANIETVDLIVQATLVLHNWLRTEDVEGKQATYVPPGFADSENEDGTVREGLWRQEPEPTGMVAGTRTTARNPTLRAKAARDNFTMYFMTSGQLHWQWRHLPDCQQQEAS